MSFFSAFSFAGPLTNSFTQPGTGINQGYPNYNGLGNQNLRPGGLNGRLPLGNSGNFNGLGSAGPRLNNNNQRGLSNGGGGIRNSGESKEDDDQEGNRPEPEEDEGEDGSQEQDGVNNEDGGQRGEGESGEMGNVGSGVDRTDQNEAGPQDGSSEEGQQNNGRGGGGGEETDGGSGEDGAGESGENDEGNESEAGDENEGGGEENGGDMGENSGGDPSNDPDLAQFERLGQGNTFPGDLFPPGLLSQQDLADIQKSMDEQAKKDAERQRQGGDEQGDSSNSSPEYDESTAAATDEPTSYIQPTHNNQRGAYRSPEPNVQNQRKYNSQLNQPNGQQSNLNTNNYLGDYGQVANQRRGAYPSSRKSNNQGEQFNHPDSYFADSNLHTDIESNVYYSPDLVDNDNHKPQSTTRLTNVPHQSTINNNFPTSTIDYDETHSSNPGNNLNG